MKSIEGFSYRIVVKVNIAICYSCDQFVYIDKRVGYELYHNYKMEKHWHTNCTRNRHCDICFKEYMKLKQKPEVESNIYTSKKDPSMYNYIEEMARVFLQTR
ncbi:6000_t:CDS:2, partial [Dentiscutata heterogama]